MQLPSASTCGWRALAVSSVLAVLAAPLSLAAPSAQSDADSDSARTPEDPFAVLDPQNWVNPDNMTWADWRAPPGTDWSNPAKKGSNRNFNIALVAVDYPDLPFAVTQPPESTVWGTPHPSAANIKRQDVANFYRDFLNKPNKLNRGHTLHEYWMEDSGGRFGVDLTPFGAYKMPLKSYQYGVGQSMNPGACPAGEQCYKEIRTDALAAWRKEVGEEKAKSFELVFILSAGEDESATWLEFGEMKFLKKEDVPAKFGPPANSSIPNYARTRYVEWTSWASASCIWPNAGGGSSTQAESSGMSTFAHELSHLLNIGDNYNNPYGKPPRRSFSGPWSMMSRGTFNGPGGPHTRWMIPPTQGSSMGSHHTIRDKLHLKLVDPASVLRVSREGLAGTGLVAVQLKARSIVPRKNELIGLRVTLDSDRSPKCDPRADPLCDGGGYDNYEMEVVQRIGSDSFTPDSGVMISKTRNDERGEAFQWTIDANPQDIRVVDFYRPDGTPAYLTVGDYRQLADALFHAGTRSGSQYEFVDKANALHFYILDLHHDHDRVLSYTVGVRSLEARKDSHKRGVTVSLGKASGGSATGKGVTCSFKLVNTGSYSPPKGGKPLAEHLKSDVYRLKASVEGQGWKVELPNALAIAKLGESATVRVAVKAEGSSTPATVVKLTATSESDAGVSATGVCVVEKGKGQQ
ncbi:hypothetical protein LOZ58_003700 [Ophidiomyces ophidiicola]|nr:hypothetical protein LOZ65_003329 [Ophidiomyces ophidiicola]KAI1942081.1 hypothetical protein LOZ66_001562 [Ophidiomyces ophidiicola]KAI1960627.1 hypothetical protein LOZ58_003700 [Ophidiomyces ophidiicola]